MVKKQKRRPGGGRKPGGEFPGKYSTFTTRIQPATRHALDAAAAASRPKRSVSAVAESILKAGLKKPSGEPRNEALAAAVDLLAKNIEKATGENWRTDQFTGMALRYAVETLLFYLAPSVEGVPTAPRAVENAAARWPPELAKRYRKPAGLGNLEAERLILELEKVTSASRHDEWSLPIFFAGDPRRLELISRDLGLGQHARGKKK